MPGQAEDMKQQWADVDTYVGDLLIPTDPHLENVLERNSAEGLPSIDVSAPQGKLLAQYVKMTNASRVLELGTLGGYSTIWMAKALPPGGKITTIEFEDHHASVAQSNIEFAGVADKVEILRGAALDVLPTLKESYDLIFIDADKQNYPGYLKLTLALSHPGTVIIADNVVRRGGIADLHNSDERVKGVRDFLRLLKEDPRLDSTVIQTVGSKGWDGFALTIVGK